MFKVHSDIWLLSYFNTSLYPLFLLIWFLFLFSIRKFHLNGTSEFPLDFGCAALQKENKAPHFPSASMNFFLLMSACMYSSLYTLYILISIYFMHMHVRCLQSIDWFHFDDEKYAYKYFYKYIFTSQATERNR